MTLAQVYQGGQFGLSFELFPPKTDAGVLALSKHLQILNQYDPSFITCTYGAGGSTRDKTLDILSSVKNEFQRPVASHLTVVGSTKDELREYLQEAQTRGIDYIVALRGDPPKGEERFQVTQGGLQYANELVDLIRSEFPDFGIAVAGYPETHQEAPSAQADLLNLKRKVDAGADVVVTQLFYDNDDFFSFREKYDALGIDVPLVPGILPVTNFAQIKRITALCGAKLPDSFMQRLGENDSEEWQFKAGVEFAIEQVRSLIEAGIPGVHFYVLNKSQATYEVLNAMDLPRQEG